jgi:hypothetical protein
VATVIRLLHAPQFPKELLGGLGATGEADKRLVNETIAGSIGSPSAGL